MDSLTKYSDLCIHSGKRAAVQDRSSPSSKELMGSTSGCEGLEIGGRPNPNPLPSMPSPYFHGQYHGLTLSDHIEPDDMFMLELLEYIP